MRLQLTITNLTAPKIRKPYLPIKTPVSAGWIHEHPTGFRYFQTIWLGKLFRFEWEF